MYISIERDFLLNIHISQKFYLFADYSLSKCGIMLSNNLYCELRKVADEQHTLCRVIQFHYLISGVTIELSYKVIGWVYNLGKP